MKTAQDLVSQAQQQTKKLNLDEAKAAIPQADALVDVREPAEFEAGHIPHAINMPRGLLEFKLEEHPKLKNRQSSLVLYCKTSGRAALCAQSLRAMGYDKVASIEGGFDAWQAADLIK